MDIIQAFKNVYLFFPRFLKEYPIAWERVAESDRRMTLWTPPIILCFFPNILYLRNEVLYRDGTLAIDNGRGMIF